MYIYGNDAFDTQGAMTKLCLDIPQLCEWFMCLVIWTDVYGHTYYSIYSIIAPTHPNTHLQDTYRVFSNYTLSCMFTVTEVAGIQQDSHPSRQHIHCTCMYVSCVANP